MRRLASVLFLITFLLRSGLTVPAERPVLATMGYRMTWGDGTCYPQCSPPNSAFIAATSTTR